MTRSTRDRVERKLDRLVDRYADDLGYHEFELLLQQRAQDVHERAAPAVTADDLDGWSE